MHSAHTRAERKAQRATRRQLDGLVVNIELTLVSIIQGVALSFLRRAPAHPLVIFVSINGHTSLMRYWSSYCSGHGQ